MEHSTGPSGRLLKKALKVWEDTPPDAPERVRVVRLTAWDSAAEEDGEKIEAADLIVVMGKSGPSGLELECAVPADADAMVYALSCLNMMGAAVQKHVELRARRQAEGRMN